MDINNNIIDMLLITNDCIRVDRSMGVVNNKEQHAEKEKKESLTPQASYTPAEKMWWRRRRSKTTNNPPSAELGIFYSGNKNCFGGKSIFSSKKLLYS